MTPHNVAPTRPKPAQANTSIPGTITSWIFGFIVFAIGLLNIFWGNDPGFGIFILLLSFVYFPPATTVLRNLTGLRIHFILKIMLGLLILWAALGVGELFTKIEMMKASFG